MNRPGRWTGSPGARLASDEAALLAEIETEFRGLADRYRDAEASAAPLLAAVEAIYRRSLSVAIPVDTLAASLP